MEMFIFVVLDAVLSGLVLWIASKITSVDLTLVETVIAAGVAAFASLLPGVGWAVSIVVLFFLLKKFSRANIWPDVVLMVIVSRLVAFVAILALGGL